PPIQDSRSPRRHSVVGRDCAVCAVGGDSRISEGRLMRRHRRSASACLHRGCVVVVLLVMTVSMGCDSSSPVTSALAPDRIPPPPSGSAPVGPTGSYLVTLTASPSCEFVTDSV